jgi:hypothetical protein
MTGLVVSGSNGYMMADAIQRIHDEVDGVQVKKVLIVSQSKSSNVWI